MATALGISCGPERPVSGLRPISSRSVASAGMSAELDTLRERFDVASVDDVRKALRKL